NDFSEDSPIHTSSADERMRPMTPLRLWTTWLAILVMAGILPSLPAEEPAVDLSGYRPDSGVTVRRQGNRLILGWPMEHQETGELIFDLRPGRPLIRSLGVVSRFVEPVHYLLVGADPSAFLRVGSREAPGGRPPDMSVFNVFFDTPASRPFQSYVATLEL